MFRALGEEWKDIKFSASLLLSRGRIGGGGGKVNDWGWLAGCIGLLPGLGRDLTSITELPFRDGISIAGESPDRMSSECRR